MSGLRLQFSTFLLVLLSTIGSIPAKGQSHPPIQKQEANIQIFPDENRYETNVTVVSTTLPNQQNNIQIVHQEQELLHELLVQYTTDKGKWIRLKNKDIHENKRKGNAFYKGLTEYSFTLPQRKKAYKFRYSYTLNSHPLLLLSGTPLATEVPIDSMIYTINYPKGYKIHHQIAGDPGLAKQFKIEEQITIQDNEEMQFRLVGVPSKITNQTPQKIRPFLQIFPGKEEIDPYQELYRRYTSLISKSMVVKDAMIEEINLALDNRIDKTNLPFALFRHIQEQFQYLNVENGLNALIPQPVDQVWKNKMGDCKDLSALFCAVTQHWGYQSHLALTSTHPYQFDMNFPALASANHVVCVIKDGENWWYFDPSYKGSIPGNPSYFTEGQPAFLLDIDEGKLVTIPTSTPTKNKTQLLLNLHEEETTFSGNFKADYWCHANSEMRKLEHQKAEALFLQQLNLGNSIIPSFEGYWNQDSLWVMSGNLISRDLFSKVEDQYYLQLSKLPFPHPFPKKLDSTAELYLGFAQEKSYELRLNFANPLQAIKEELVQFDQDGFRFDFSLKQVSDSCLVIEYSYSIDTSLVSGSLVDAWNDWNDYLGKYFQGVRVFKW